MAPAAMPGPTSGNVTRRKTVIGRAPEGRRRILEPPVRRPQRSFHRQHQVRQRDEDLGQHHRVRGEREAETGQLVERAAEQARAAEHGEQGHSADHRRQHQRHGDQGPEQRRPRKARTGQQPGKRNAEQHRDDHRDRGRDQREPERQQGCAAAQHRPGASDHGARTTQPDQRATAGTAGRVTASSPSSSGTRLRHAAGCSAPGSASASASHGLGKARLRPGRPGPSGDEHVVDEGLGDLRSLGLGQRGDRVVVDRLAGLGEVDAVDLVPAADHVRPVDQSRVHLVERPPWPGWP